MTRTLTRPETRTPGATTSTGARAFTILTGLTTAAILVQAVIAGQFVGKDAADGWITTHGVIADVTWGLALVTAAVGAVTLRRTAPRLVAAACGLFVLTLAQTGIGHLITDKGEDGWIPVHVPLAVLIFGLAIWLSVQTARLRRAGREV